MTDPVLWTAEEAAAAVGAETDAAWTATGVSIDSRTVAAGDLFVALKGPVFDAHEFVADALAKGAAGAIVNRRPDEMADDGRLLVVDDTLRALEALGRAARARTAARVVAVTGSVGKTGTKEALKLVLDRHGKTHASAGSYNNQWGVPLSLARMPADTDYAVFEIGMNHAGEITPLVKLARPHVAMITTVEAVHLEFFDSVQGIADAKAEIFLGLEPDGTAILNRDNPRYEQLLKRAGEAGVNNIVAFGSHPEAAVRLINFALHPTCSCISADIAGQPVTYKVASPGRHWVMNSLGVMAVLHVLGGDFGLAGLALAQMTPPKGRGQRHRVELRSGSFELIDDSYNASPAAMKAAFETLAATTPGARGRRIAVLGDMRELGDQADRLHAALADDLEETGIDLVFTAGTHMAKLHAALPDGRRGAHVEQSDDLPALLAQSVRSGDVVLVKGSLGSRMGPVVDALLGRDADGKQAANG
ncbi:MAG: UDP-N-acetylmuramoylalanyl-D-glutamyl-2,6-diaminopimelate--D-alanyl-D-alanine ligase [Minwuiales bacterium]|nr:UDP-N-acetylmuramoylalanyl-D-glutamyl-2,6-diaminopimelate--D-alanyl-D-alanine ligase [Minwuiales bacterium]